MNNAMVTMPALCCALMAQFLPAPSLACSVQTPPPQGFPRPGATHVSTATTILVFAPSTVGTPEPEVTADGARVPVERVEKLCSGYWRVVTGRLPPLASIKVKLPDPELDREYLTEFETASGPVRAPGTPAGLAFLDLKQTHYIGRNGSAGCLFADDEFWADFMLVPSSRSDTPEDDVLYKLAIASKDGSASIDFCMTGDQLRSTGYKTRRASWGAMNTSLGYCGSVSSLGREDDGWTAGAGEACTTIHTEQAWGCSAAPAAAIPCAALLCAALLLRRRRRHQRANVSRDPAGVARAKREARLVRRAGGPARRASKAAPARPAPPLSASGRTGPSRRRAAPR